ncbi:MAG: cytochrome C oxidase subunit IV family protein [Anaerolineales bacterium]|nr:cytochrome C oxidase subunit IV family protein [Anaerolineales bacterium]MCB9126521.1 cytochrome C oxidase subunit IV family protein [Ardenticatenales bacterium]
MAHIVPVRTYLMVGLALILLTAITVAVAYVDLGPLNEVVALAVAAIKATLIVLIFMNARYAKGPTKLFIFMGLIMMAIFMVFTMDDYMTRQWTLFTQP